MAVRVPRPVRLLLESKLVLKPGVGPGKIRIPEARARRHGICLYHSGPRSQVNSPVKQRPGRSPTEPDLESTATPAPEAFSDIWNRRKWPLVGMFAVSFLVGMYVSVMIVSSVRNRPEIEGKTARECDAELEGIETQTGMRALRAKVAARARGHVLEVAIGTGRSLPHYGWETLVADDRDEIRRRREDERVRLLLEKHGWTGAQGEARAKRLASTLELGEMDGEVLSLTAVDISSEKLSLAQERLRESVPGLKNMAPGDEPTAAQTVVDELDHRVRLVRADAQEPLPPPPDVPGWPEAQAYDTVTQSFGLCSVEDPVRVLAQMAAVVQPGTGRILLVEHGRCFWDWLNRALLDRFADAHYCKYGCYWNRDISALVNEAVTKVPGLEIVKLERPYRFLGTTVLVELRVKADESGKFEEVPQRTGWMGFWDRWKSQDVNL